MRIEPWRQEGKGVSDHQNEECRKIRRNITESKNGQSDHSRPYLKRRRAVLCGFFGRGYNFSNFQTNLSHYH